MRQEAGIFQEQLGEFFKYQVYEFDSMQELQNLVKRFQKEFFAADKKLDAKKEELFRDKRIEKWKLDPQVLNVFTRENLIKDKRLAFSKMLPKVPRGNNEGGRKRKMHITFTCPSATTSTASATKSLVFTS